MKSTELATIPLTMSTLEIAGLTGKAHKHVLADARKMLMALEIQPADFSARYLDAKNEAREVMNLPKRECLILVSGYSVETRARIIDRWMELEAALVEPTGPILSGEAKSAIGGIVKNCTRVVIHDEISAILPKLVAAELASRGLSVRTGRTAGWLWREFGFPPLKGISVWFGNRLEQMGCATEYGGCGELGVTKARLFDPDKARVWINNGGRLIIEQRVKERLGQGVLKLVTKKTPEAK